MFEIPEGADLDLIEALIEDAMRRLEAEADPVKAVEMAAYMKTSMPFYGVQSKPREQILRAIKKAHPIQDAATYVGAVYALWCGEHREEKYLAVRLARAYKKQITLAHLPLYEQMIREGAWWDFTDEITTHLVGPVLRKSSEDMWPIMDAWLEDELVWIRRAAIICQLGAKKETDAEWLFAACEARMHEKEFFIRKAIGWALREYARQDPDAVRRWTATHRDSLSGLSYREARKHL